MIFKSFEEFQKWIKANPPSEDEDYYFEEMK